MLFDNLTTEVSTLKHYALSLRHENSEMKHSIAELTSSRFELTKEVKQLKELVSNLMEQQTLFNSSLMTLQKETKNLMRENIQIKSKYEIFQVRLKSLQERDSTQRLSIPLMSSPQQIFGAKQDGDGDQEFQLSPRLDNIVNKTTKNRLESLKKDLEDVFKKREGYKDESPKAEKETIMEEWSNPSDLNISQTHSDRSQITTITYPHGEHSFHTGFNQGQPSSLMEQVEMLNMPQRDNFLSEELLDISPRGGMTSKSDNNKKKESGHKKNAFSTETPRSRDTIVNNKGNNNNMDKDIMEEKKMSVPPIKVAMSSQVPSQQSKPFVQLPSTASTTGVTQNSLLGPENYSYYPTYQGGDGSPSQRLEMAQKGKANYGYGDSSIKGLEVMDMKMKKELYLKEENMLIKVLDRLDEQPYNKAPLHFSSESHQHQQQLNSDLYRYLKPDNVKEQVGNSNFTQKIMETIGIPEAHPNDTSTTSTGMRGTKKLRLFRKSLKPNPSPKNTDYTNQRLHTE